MNQICAKVYYLISTGEVITITSETQGDVTPTTKEQDMIIYPQLKDKSIDDVDYVEIEYGTLSTVFNNVLSCSVNIDTKTLNIAYRAQEEIDAENQALAEQEVLQSRVSVVTSYANQNTASIDNLENAIIQYELNNIENGVS